MTFLLTLAETLTESPTWDIGGHVTLQYDESTALARIQLSLRLSIAESARAGPGAP